MKTRVMAGFFVRVLLLAGAFMSGRQNGFAGGYTNDFSAGPGAAVISGNASLVGGQLQLTPNAQLQYGTLLLNDLDPGTAIQSFTATFNLTIDGHGKQGADGFSLNFANPASYPPINSYYEQGAGSGLNFRFATYTTLQAFIGTNSIGLAGTATYGSAMTDGTKQPVTISYNKATGATLAYRGQTISVTAAQLYGFSPQAGFKFLFGARCGGGTENHLIDDVVVITVPQSANASLANLLPSAGTLAPPFSENTTIYAVNVANAVTNLTLTPTVAQSNATVQVNGTTVASGSSSGNIALNVGTNVITLVVTAENGTTTKSYTVTAVRAGSSNADLASLTTSVGTIQPAFSGNTLNYSVEISNSVSSATITPTVAGPNATVTVNGVPVASGSPSECLPLNPGANTIAITVTAEDLITVKTYTLSVTRPLSSNADLATLECSVPTGITPAFSPGTTNYAASTTYNIVGTFVRVIQADPNASIEMRVDGGSFNGIFPFIATEVPLHVGTNTVDWRITAQDGTTKIYTIAVVRGGPRHNNDLVSLSLNNAPFTPVFNYATNSYSVILPYYFEFDHVVATRPGGYLGTLEVRCNGGSYSPLASGTPSGPLALNLGTNLVEVRVTGEDSTSQIYSVTIVRSPPGGAGEVDLFNAAISSGGYRVAFAVQPDQKILIGGALNFLDRVNSDGSLDSSFPNVRNTSVSSLLLYRDGSIMIGAGEFTSHRLEHVQSDGSQMPGTVSLFAKPYWLGLDNDGLVLVGGNFINLADIGHVNHLARLLPDGMPDAPGGTSTNGFKCYVPDVLVKPLGFAVYSLALQPDGMMVIGGKFTNLTHALYFFPFAGSTESRQRLRLGRVDTVRGGVIDEDFAPEANDVVYCLALQPDGKILVGGKFTTINGVTCNHIARLNADGSLDVNFNADVSDTSAADTFTAVRSIALQTDGRIIFCGTFTTVNGVGRNHIARLNADGSLDMGFDPNPTGSYDGLYGVGLQADGRVLVAGQFTGLAPRGGPNLSRGNFARLLNDPATQSLSVPDATQVTWTRGGSSPEISRVQMDVSTDGGTNWTSLGFATRIGITPNWQLTGLNLPVNGQLRAWGYARAGEYNGSGMIIESVTNFVVKPLQPLITQPSLTNGIFQFHYTNANSAAFTVLATTNVSLPIASWTVLGTATNVSTNTFQFTDPAAGGSVQRFYQLRFP